MLAQHAIISKPERGQGLVEYALVIVLLAVVVIVALNFLGGGITNALYNEIIANI